MLTVDEDDEEEVRENTEAGEYDLNPDEVWWRDRIQILNDHGYQLRPRLRPGWEPSWKDTNTHPLMCEDALIGFGSLDKTVDAVRVRDRKDVRILKTRRYSRERAIFEHLVDAQRSAKEDQHIIQILDTFEDAREPDLVFMVMPLMIPAWSTRDFLGTIADLLDMFQQILEGLSFIHSKNIAHRGHWLTIMLDAPSMFPRGFHPTDYTRDRSGVGLIKYIPRYKASGHVRYYFSDFEYSLRIERDPKRIVGLWYPGGSDAVAPEWTDRVIYDPFPADVFVVGKVFKTIYLSYYKNVNFLLPFVEAMTAEKPEDRPTAADALKQLQTIITSQSYFSLRHRLVKRDSKSSWFVVLQNIVLQTIGILLEATFKPVKVAFRIASLTINAMRKLVDSKKKSD
ncbi:hypothetical protein SCHPADRAFT_940066 [Schizopora paradoxa]|uniref:Protein kinase domain-containing protein n=1 Tax=Schizopora paradoxa TaxID=27342 RepID=A0A0H2SAF6_9AGAM|nr:hypothetical protein SCHPADRAFT_940066 [Schizopora paradoxa]